MNNSKEQIAYIEEMIASAKGNLAEGSSYYLLWGWLVFLAATINYVLLKFTDFENHWVAWPVLMSLGGIISIIMSFKKSKERKVLTKIDKVLIHLWSGFGITLMVCLIGMIAVGEKGIYPVFMALYGLGTFVSGSIVGFKPLKIGAVAAWVCASIAFFQVDYSNHLILLAAAILFSYIIPGHLLAVKR